MIPILLFRPALQTSPRLCAFFAPLRETSYAPPREISFAPLRESSSRLCVKSSSRPASGRQALL